MPHTANAIFDDFEKLEDTFVLYAGEFESLTCPVTGKYDCLKWPTNLLKLKYKDICIIPSSISACSRFGCKGLLVKTKTGEVELFTFNDFSSAKASMSGLKPVKCPQMY
jgi:hypothetical protein